MPGTTCSLRPNCIFGGRESKCASPTRLLCLVWLPKGIAWCLNNVLLEVCLGSPRTPEEGHRMAFKTNKKPKQNPTLFTRVWLCAHNRYSTTQKH